MCLLIYTHEENGFLWGSVAREEELSQKSAENLSSTPISQNLVVSIYDSTTDKGRQRPLKPIRPLPWAEVKPKFHCCYSGRVNHELTTRCPTWL